MSNLTIFRSHLVLLLFMLISNVRCQEVIDLPCSQTGVFCMGTTTLEPSFAGHGKTHRFHRVNEISPFLALQSGCFLNKDCEYMIVGQLIRAKSEIEWQLFMSIADRNKPTNDFVHFFVTKKGYQIKFDSREFISLFFLAE